MASPIVFLDFDGVLNTAKTWGNRREHAVDADKVALLNNLVEATDAVIVISSTWRRCYTLAELQGFLQMRGLERPDRVVDVTGGDDEGLRGEEISNWLTAHCNPKDWPNFVILDDMPVNQFEGLLKHFVQIKSSEGLTVFNCKTAARVLSGGELT